MASIHNAQVAAHKDAPPHMALLKTSGDLSIFKHPEIPGQVLLGGEAV